MAELENEFEFGRGKRVKDDSFSLARYWQKGYGIDRFSPAYITSCHSIDPQAVFKIISFGKGKDSTGKGRDSAKAMLEYVNFRKGVQIDPNDLDNFDKVIKDSDGNYHESIAQEFYTESGEVLQGQKDIDELYSAWASEFRKKGSGQGQQRHLTHMLFSADVEPLQRNANSVLAAAQKTLWEEFGQFGFEYTYVLHTDTEHPHVHCILKNYNNRTKRKLRIDRHDLLRIRTEFSNQLTDRGLKKHIATLRRDRPEMLLRAQKIVSQISAQETLIRETVNQSQFYHRPSQINAQLNKEIKQHDYQNLSITFDSSNPKSIRIIANKNGAHVEKILKHLAYDLGSKSFNIGVGDTASVKIHDIDAMSVEQRKLIALNFNKLVENKDSRQSEKRVKKTKDVLAQYKSTLIRVNRSIAWIKKNKLLTSVQKKATIKELTEVKNRLLNNYDVNNIQDVHLLVSGRIGSSAAKEMLTIEKSQLTAAEFHKRYLSLQVYVDQQKDQTKDLIKSYSERGDKDMVKALKGLVSTQGHKSYIKHQEKSKRRLLERHNNTKNLLL